MRVSNSPFFTPCRNAAISAWVYTSAGPEGSRELRIAISPPNSPATSTQLPFGLLTTLLRQRTPFNWSAGTPFSTCMSHLQTVLTQTMLIQNQVRTGTGRWPTCLRPCIGHLQLQRNRPYARACDGCIGYVH